MFEQEIELVKKHLLEQLFSSQQYTYIHEILNNPELDDAYKTFFGAEVNWWIYEEQSLRHSNPRFDIDAPEIRQALLDLDTKYRSVARFDHEELTATVDAAAKARLNFLCRPRTALKWFVFRGEPTKPLHEILLRMNFFSDHRYLIDGFKEWSKQRRIDRPMEILSVVEFERIVERIDNEAIFDLSPQQFVDLLAPVFSFFQVPSTRIPSGTIPTEALIIFLDDKGVVPISQTLENLLYNDELRYITKERFLEIVDNIVQDMDAEQNTVPDSTLPLEFDAILSANSEKREIFKSEPVVNEPEIQPEIETEEEVIKEEVIKEEVIKEEVIKEEVIKEEENSELLKESPVENDAEEVEAFKNEEIPAENEILKEEIIEENSKISEVFRCAETPDSTELLKEEIDKTQPENTEEEVFKNDENIEYKEVLKTEESEAENPAEEIVEQAEIAAEQEVLKEEVLKEEVLHEDEPHDSFLEDIHRFKNTETIIEFDGSLPEEIIGQTILQDNVDRTEISETEKHKQELAEKNPEVKLPSISQFIDAKHIEKFTKKLFKRDNVEYVRFLKELESTAQWKEAARHIDRHLAQNGIEPDSSIAKEFRELVHKRYGK